MRDFFKVLYVDKKEEYYKKLNEYLDEHTKKFIVTANPETFMRARTDEELRRIILNSDNDIIPDGIAIVKGAHILGMKVSERITGIDTSLELLRLLSKKKGTLYLFGASKEVVEKTVEVIKRDYKDIDILGYTDGYVEDKEEAFEKIVKMQPDVCLVALGIPKQEKLIGKYMSKVKKGIYMGVGGTFDVLSGEKKRAPKIFIKLNLEWFYRLIKEPKRIKRFYDNNIKFLIEVFKIKIKK